MVHWHDAVSRRARRGTIHPAGTGSDARAIASNRNRTTTKGQYMRSILLSGITIAAIIVTTPTVAQTERRPAGPEEADQEMGGDVVVTARRVEERLQDVPISITAFTQTQLTDRNIVSAGDIATYTPSLSSNSRFGSEKTSFGIRGFNQDNSTAPSVGVYFADAPALRAQGGTTTANGTGPGAFFDLANVQVLKGPQGTLFGRNTSGGAVLLVPQKPTPRLEGYVEGSIGNYNMRRIQAVVNIPVMDSLRIRLGVDRQTRDGYMKNVSGIGPEDFSDTDYYALRFSAVADLSPNLENYFIGTYGKSDTSGFLPRVFECNRQMAATSPATTNSALVALACAQADRANNRDFYTGENSVIAPYQYVQQFQFVNTTTWNAGDTLTLKNIISYGEYRESLRSTVYGENLVVTSGPNAGASGLRALSDPYPGRRNVAQSTFSEELRLQGTAFSGRMTWQTGAYFEASDPLGMSGVLTGNTVACTSTDPYYGCGAFVPAAGTGTTSSSLSSVVWKYFYQDYGLYAQSSFKVSDKFSVTGGIRYTWDYYQLLSRALNALTIPPDSVPVRGYCSDLFAFGVRGSAGNPGTKTQEQCETYQRAHSQAPTWLIDFDYKPTDDILLYAKYARGYRQGQMRSAGYGRQAFGPEKIDNYEIGLKTTWRGAIRGTFNVAAFYNDFSDQQVTASANFRAIPTQSVVIVNAGKSRIMGVEVDGSLSPFQGLMFDFGYAYLDTKVKSLVPPPPDLVFSEFRLAGALEGYPLTYAPRHKVTITGTYTLPFDESIGRISVGATFTHNSSQYATFSDTTPAIIAAVGRDLGLLPPLSLLNLNLNWRSVAGAPVDLALFATNVTKERYATSTFGGYPSFGLEAMSAGEPRMYGLRLKYRFGS
ncbi:MAG: TonB-dependent receptor [Sphingobium sp.]